MTRWCILRTAGPRTLLLVDSLNRHGVRAWTPTTTARRRKSRRSPSFVVRQAAMLPTFVFADADHLGELCRYERSPVSPHPPYSVFRYYHRAPLVGDAAIEALRMFERQAVPKAERRTVPVGSTIRLPDGPFAGLDGIVQASDGGYTLVAFGGRMEVKIETFILSENTIRAE